MVLAKAKHTAVKDLIACKVHANCRPKAAVVFWTRMDFEEVYVMKYGNWLIGFTEGDLIWNIAIIGFEKILRKQTNTSDIRWNVVGLPSKL